MSRIESEQRTDEMRDELTKLAQAISKSPEFVAFEEAQKRLNESEDAQRLIREYQSKQRRFQMFGGFGNVADQSELQRARDAMTANREVRDFLKSQEELADFFRDVNRVIGKNLGFDFGQACAPAAGCC
jgi:cell fate (sporulation/competence/biofilm development) regulator YlbF (YheA/YmcA/DUF963 family)